MAVIGAGGALGQLTVARLVAEGFRVRAFSRPDSSLQQLPVSEVVRVDVQQTGVKELANALAGCRFLVSTLGVKPPVDQAKIDEVETNGVIKLVEAARQAGLEHFVLTTSIGTERPETLPFLTKILYAKRKAEIYLTESGLTFTIVRPGGLLTQPGGAKLLVGRGDQISGQISREDVARVLVEALRQPTAAQQIIEIVQSEDGKLPADPLFFRS